MGGKLTLFIILFSLFIDNISPLENFTACYFDGRYQTPSKIANLIDDNCSPTNVTQTAGNGNLSECEQPHGANGYPLFDPAINKETFILSVDTGIGFSEKDSPQNETILIVSISNITFQNLTIQLENIADTNWEIIMQTICFEENNIPDKMNVFVNVKFLEYHRSKIQFFARSGKDLKFYKEYHSKIPGENDIDNREKIVNDRVFGYVDTTWRDKVVLHIQPLPKEFNITEYEVRFKEGSTGHFHERARFNLSGEKLEFEQSDFQKNGFHSFDITPIDANGKSHRSSSGAVFCMIKTGPPLLIMIVGIVAIPLGLFAALYMIYNVVLKKKVKAWLKQRQPKVLLVYSATNDFHVAVVDMLAQYLKSCHTIVMFDKWGVPATVHENPGDWLDRAFPEAKIIIIIASPPSNKCIVRSTAYIGLDQRAYTLIHESRKREQKKYLGISLPYCNTFKSGVDYWLSERLEMPKDLKKLLNEIHGFSYSELFRAPDNQRQLIEIIELATSSIRDGNPIEIPESFQNLLGLKPSILPEETFDIDEKHEVDAIDEHLMWEDPKDNDNQRYNFDIRNIDLRGGNNY